VAKLAEVGRLRLFGILKVLALLYFKLLLSIRLLIEWDARREFVEI